MKENLIKFNCDNCKNELIVREEDGFPYIHGWCYVYNFNCQIENIPKGNEKKILNPFIRIKRIKDLDKHFCSKKCMLKYLERRVK